MENENPFICDPQLRELKAKIKKVMMPLMIRVFEHKLSIQMFNCPTSRLLNKPQEPSVEICQQLEGLYEDLKMLNLWVLSCQKQIEKALAETSIKQHQIAVTHSQKPSSLWIKNWVAK